MFVNNNFPRLGLIGAMVLGAVQIGSITVKAPITPSLPVQHSSQKQINLSPETVDPAQTPEVDALADGQYQFCSQPEPKDGRDGAGVCLNFTKVDDRIDGYYGYPHSGNFICIRGQADGDRIKGTALAISWAGHPWTSIPTSKFTWDPEGHLILNQGYIVRSLKDKFGQTDWIQFDQAWLNVEAFYRYSASKMSPPSQLCEWQN